MAVELVTGYSGTAHVSSSEDGARQAGTVGTGMYVLETNDDPLAATLENSNTVTIGAGDALINGRHVQLTGSTSFAIPVGTQAMQTSNLLVLRYSLEDTGVESVEALTLTGEPAESDPQDPAINAGSILDGDSPVDMPLYRVVTTGIETAQPVRLFETVPPIAGLEFADISGNLPTSRLSGTFPADSISGTLPVEHGGTGLSASPSLLVNLGSTSAASVMQASPRPGVTGTLPVERGGTGVTTSKAIALKAYPLGAVYISYYSTSPASLFGGSWTPITGRFPYFNAGVGTGGANSVTLTTAQIPAHSHTFTNSVYLNDSSGDEAGNHSTWWTTQRSTTTIKTTNTGGGGSFSNMPQYQTLYAWIRTA